MCGWEGGVCWENSPTLAGCWRRHRRLTWRCFRTACTRALGGRGGRGEGWGKGRGRARGRERGLRFPRVLGSRPRVGMAWNDSIVDPFIYSFMHSFIHLCIRSFIHSAKRDTNRDTRGVYGSEKTRSGDRSAPLKPTDTFLVPQPFHRRSLALCLWLRRSALRRPERAAQAHKHMLLWPLIRLFSKP